MDDLLQFGPRVRQETWTLLWFRGTLVMRKPEWHRIAQLAPSLGKIDAPAVDTRRGPGLESPNRNPKSSNSLCQFYRGLITGPPSGDRLTGASVHSAPKESSRRDYNAFRGKAQAIHCLDSVNTLAVNAQLCYRTLAKIEERFLLKKTSDRSAV